MEVSSGTPQPPGPCTAALSTCWAPCSLAASWVCKVPGAGGRAGPGCTFE